MIYIEFQPDDSLESPPYLLSIDAEGPNGEKEPPEELVSELVLYLKEKFSLTEDVDPSKVALLSKEQWEEKGYHLV